MKDTGSRISQQNYPPQWKVWRPDSESFWPGKSGIFHSKVWMLRFNADFSKYTCAKWSFFLVHGQLALPGDLCQGDSTTLEGSFLTFKWKCRFYISRGCPKVSRGHYASTSQAFNIRRARATREEGDSSTSAFDSRAKTSLPRNNYRTKWPFRRLFKWGPQPCTSNATSKSRHRDLYSVTFHKPWRARKGTGTLSDKHAHGIKKGKPSAW